MERKPHISNISKTSVKRKGKLPYFQLSRTSQASKSKCV